MILSGNLFVTLLIFSGRPDPQWTVDSSHPEFNKIQQLLQNARTCNATYDRRQIPARLGYKGFLVKDKAQNKQELILGPKTVSLQLSLLETLPEDVLPKERRDWIVEAINDQKGISDMGNC